MTRFTVDTSRFGVLLYYGWELEKLLPSCSFILFTISGFDLERKDGIVTICKADALLAVL